MKTNTIFKFLAFISLCSPFSLEAFQMSPMIMEIAPAGKGSSQSVVLYNNSDRAEAIELRIFHRKHDINGNEDYTEDAEDNFLLYPPQMILGPKESQAVQISWVGDTHLSRELPFRLVAEQVPLKEVEKDPQVKMSVEILLRIVGSVYVASKNVKPELRILNTSYKDKGEEGKFLLLNLKNEGTAHEVTTDKRLEIELANKSKLILEGEQAKALTGINILAGDERNLYIPWPSDWPIPQGVIKASFLK
ncbi:MAG: hypothetical protein K0S74_106 [Chlamydiales bacterium]|jgi:fimbrial chaperone protein|nr:hypothetical protein [Chlamydiales bacterium]